MAGTGAGRCFSPCSGCGHRQQPDQGTASTKLPGSAGSRPAGPGQPSGAGRARAAERPAGTPGQPGRPLADRRFDQRYRRTRDPLLYAQRVGADRPSRSATLAGQPAPGRQHRRCVVDVQRHGIDTEPLARRTVCRDRARPRAAPGPLASSRHLEGAVALVAAPGLRLAGSRLPGDGVLARWLAGQLYAGHTPAGDRRHERDHSGNDRPRQPRSYRTAAESAARHGAGLRTDLWLAAAAWSVAFGLFVWHYWPMLSRPRPDGGPG